MCNSSVPRVYSTNIILTYYYIIFILEKIKYDILYGSLIFYIQYIIYYVYITRSIYTYFYTFIVY